MACCRSCLTDHIILNVFIVYLVQHQRTTMDALGLAMEHVTHQCEAYEEMETVIYYRDLECFLTIVFSALALIPVVTRSPKYRYFLLLFFFWTLLLIVLPDAMHYDTCIGRFGLIIEQTFLLWRVFKFYRMLSARQRRIDFITTP